MINSREKRAEASKWWMHIDRTNPSFDEENNPCLSLRLSVIGDKGAKTLVTAAIAFGCNAIMSLLLILAALLQPEIVFGSQAILSELVFLVGLCSTWMTLRHSYHWDAFADTLRRHNVYGFYDDDGETSEQEPAEAEAAEGTEADFESFVTDASGKAA